MPDTELTDLLAESEQRGRRRLGWIHAVIPVGILAAVCIPLFLADRLGEVSAAVLTSFFTIGKLIILVGALPDNQFGMTTLELAVTVLCMDTFVAYSFAYNLHHVYRVPKAGPWLQRIQNYCRYWFTKQPWMRRWAFTGVMLFVMFPLTGTGAPGGSILGRLGGLRAPTTLFAIFTGSLLGCTLLAAFATELEPLFERLRHEWWFTALGIAFLVIVILLLVVLGRKLSRAAEEAARATGGER